MNKPAIFISAVSSEFGSIRRLIAESLTRLGYEPITQEIFGTESGDLTEVLCRKIDQCEGVVHIAGVAYGAEPPAPHAQFGRVSYTQFEFLYARQKKLKTWVIIPGDGCAPDKPVDRLDLPHDPAARDPLAWQAERRDLQRRYRETIQGSSHLWHRPESRDGLILSVERMRDELAALRKQSDARHRRTLRLLAAVAAGIAVVGGMVVGGIRLLHRGQAAQAVRLDQQSAKADEQTAQLGRIEKLLADQRQANPKGDLKLPGADQAWLDTARHQGDLKSRAAAAVLQPDADTDALLAQLLSQHDAEAFDLAMLNGKRWYFARPIAQFDKAVPFFESAIRVRPDSVDARDYAADAHNSARLGDISSHRRRAIEICEGTLKIVPSHSAAWAMTQDNLANAWQSLPTGDRAKNLETAIACYTQALQVRTKADFPAEWPATQNNLAAAWSDLPTGDRAKNVQTAIACYNRALEIYTKADSPSDWAGTQYNLANAWRNLPTGDPAKNAQTAIACYNRALEVYTKADFPAEWAATQNNLAVAWQNLPTGDPAKNLQTAIDGYTRALQIRTKADFPADWATTQNNLGTALAVLPTGDRAKNLQTAIACYTGALEVHTKAGFPADWAMTQYNLAMALAEMADRPTPPAGQDRCGLLRRAIACSKGALTIYTLDAFPREHASTTQNLDIDRRAYEAASCTKKTPFDHIPPAQ